MDTSGSIRSSNKGSKRGFQPQSIEPALLDTAKQFLESFQFDMRIKQLLRPEKMEMSLGKHKFHVLGNEQKYEPGFLICMKGQPTLFIHGRLQFGFVLRLRLHSAIHMKGSIFIGTLDTVNESFRFEDVLLFAGEVCNQNTYSQRYQKLQDFMENFFVQDKRLSGLICSLAEPQPLANLKEVVESGQFYSVDLIPEDGGRRRFLLQLAVPPPSQPRVPNNKMSIKNENKEGLPVVSTAELVTPPQSVKITNTILTKAIAFKIMGMPDTYELKDEQGIGVGRAAVQTSAISIQLRGAFQKGAKSIPVEIQWYEEFERYKITGLV